MNTLQAPVLVKAGEASYSFSGFSSPRWGDYSAVAIDPSDETVTWGAGEYATAAAGGGNRGTWIAELKAGAGSPDTTPPSITITTPANGATYGINQQVASSYACTDPDDAVATCAGPVASNSNIDTGPGMHTFTVNATDSHGNASSKSVTYTVPAPIGPLIVAPSSLILRARVGSSSRPRSVKVKNPKSNSGDAIVILITTGTSHFTIDPGTTTCGSTLPLGKTCKVGIIFNAAATGSESDTLFLNDNGSNAPQQVGLSGVGK